MNRKKSLLGHVQTFQGLLYVKEECYTERSRYWGVLTIEGTTSVIIIVGIYNSDCGNNQDFICRVCDEKGSYGHGKVDPVINIKIAGWLFP